MSYGVNKNGSIYEQRSKLKLKELIEIGSTSVPSTTRGDEDFLAILSNSIKQSRDDKIIINYYESLFIPLSEIEFVLIEKSNVPLTILASIGAVIGSVAALYLYLILSW